MYVKKQIVVVCQNQREIDSLHEYIEEQEDCTVEHAVTARVMGGTEITITPHWDDRAPAVSSHDRRRMNQQWIDFCDGLNDAVDLN